VSREQQEFSEFFQSSWEPCLRATVAGTGDPEQAEELVAEAFARAWGAWRKVSRHPAPRAWVVRTALNTGRTRWRRRRPELPLDGHDAPAPPDGSGDVDTRMLAALRRLPLRQREVVALRVFLDLDIDTTARQLRIAPGTVRAHLARAVATLRRELTSAEITEAHR
jgi:RNA polymerase sigma-70 factor (sigma-E family)